MPSDKEEADINDLIQIINNPQHETDIELPGPDPGKSGSGEREDPDDTFSLYDIDLPIVTPPH